MSHCKARDEYFEVKSDQCQEPIARYYAPGEEKRIVKWMEHLQQQVKKNDEYIRELERNSGQPKTSTDFPVKSEKSVDDGSFVKGRLPDSSWASNGVHVDGADAGEEAEEINSIKGYLQLAPVPPPPHKCDPPEITSKWSKAARCAVDSIPTGSVYTCGECGRRWLSIKPRVYNPGYWYHPKWYQLKYWFKIWNGLNRPILRHS